MISLQSRAKRAQVFVLPHAVVCTEETCGCSRQVTGVTTHDPKTGKKTVRAIKRKLADSVTILAMGHPGDRVDDLPDGVARLPSVLRAEKRRELIVIRHDNDKHLADLAKKNAAAAAKE